MGLIKKCRTCREPATHMIELGSVEVWLCNRAECEYEQRDAYYQALDWASCQ